MSLMNSESMDYSNTILTWKLPPKKCIDLKNPVDILVATNHHNNLDIPQNTFHAQVQDDMAKQFTQYAPIHENHIPNRTGMIFSHLPHTVNANIQIHQLKPNESLNIQQIMPMPAIPPENENPPIRSNILKKKTQVVPKKVKRIPVDGIAYHSKQLGLKVPPKQVIFITLVLVYYNN